MAYRVIVGFLFMSHEKCTYVCLPKLWRHLKRWNEVASVQITESLSNLIGEAVELLTFCLFWRKHYNLFVGWSQPPWKEIGAHVIKSASAATAWSSEATRINTWELGQIITPPQHQRLYLPFPTIFLCQNWAPWIPHAFLFLFRLYESLSAPRDLTAEEQLTAPSFTRNKITIPRTSKPNILYSSSALSLIS